MNRPFILGLNPPVDSAFYDTKSLLGLVGGNTGNLIFNYAVNQSLGGSLPRLRLRSAASNNIDKLGDIAVLPCANHLGEHEDRGDLVDKLINAKANMVAIGLGAQQTLGGTIPDVPQGTIDWIKAIISHAPTSKPNISVRGNFTLSVLKKYGLSQYAEVLGCPSLFINPNPGLGRIIAQKLLSEPKFIGVVSGDIRLKELSKIESSLTSMVENNKGSYILQSSIHMMKICRGEDKFVKSEEIISYRNYVYPEINENDFRLWLRKYGRVFFNVPAWLEYYRRFDLVIGTRFHGVSLAIQAGVPALCIVHDARTHELCELMCIPYIFAKDHINGIDSRNLFDLISFDPVKFDKNRLELAARYKNFLLANGLMPKIGIFE